MFEYLKFSLTVRWYSNSLQNSLEIQGSSCSCLELLPLSHSPQKIIPSSVLRHGHKRVLHLFIPLLGVSVCVQVRHMDVVDSQGYFKRQSIIPAVTQVK